MVYQPPFSKPAVVRWCLWRTRPSLCSSPRFCFLNFLLPNQADLGWSQLTTMITTSTVTAIFVLIVSTVVFSQYIKSIIIWNDHHWTATNTIDRKSWVQFIHSPIIFLQEYFLSTLLPMLAFDDENTGFFKKKKHELPPEVRWLSRVVRASPAGPGPGHGARL